MVKAIRANGYPEALEGNSVKGHTCEGEAEERCIYLGRSDDETYSVSTAYCPSYEDRAFLNPRDDCDRPDETECTKTDRDYAFCGHYMLRDGVKCGHE
jgi:hypothetical protein